MISGGDGSPAGERPREIRHSNPEHGGVTLVDWMLGNSCNFACSYCPAGQHDGTIRWQRPEAVIAFYDRLHAHYVAGQGRRVREPLLIRLTWKPRACASSRIRIRPG